VTVYVLGAGASHHAGYPLAAQLGESITQWLDVAHESEHCPRWRIEQYKSQFAQVRQHYASLHDFELIVTDLQRWSRKAIKKRRSCPFMSPANVAADIRSAIADFFAQIRQEAHLYRQFADEKLKNGDVVISFNYDVAIERELKRAGLWEISDGYGFNVLQSHSKSPVVVLKLHGSVNWVQCLGVGGIMAITLYDQRPAIMPHDLAYLGYVDRDPAWREGGVDRPRIVLPGRKKSLRTKLYQVLWSAAANALRRAERLVIVGYSMPDADEAAQQLLLGATNRDAEVNICCCADGPRMCRSFFSAGFERVTDDVSLEHFLSVGHSENISPTWLFPSQGGTAAADGQDISVR
jgi:hypothetical protein